MCCRRGSKRPPCLAAATFNLKSACTLVHRSPAAVPCPSPLHTRCQPQNGRQGCLQYTRQASCACTAPAATRRQSHSTPLTGNAHFCHGTQLFFIHLTGADLTAPLATPCLCLTLPRSSMFISHGRQSTADGAQCFSGTAYHTVPALLSALTTTRTNSCTRFCRFVCTLFTSRFDTSAQQELEKSFIAGGGACSPPCPSTTDIVDASPLYLIYLDPGHFVGLVNGTLPAPPAPPEQGSSFSHIRLSEHC